MHSRGISSLEPGCFVGKALEVINFGLSTNVGSPRKHPVHPLWVPLQGWGAQSLPRDQFHFLFLCLFKGKESHFLLGGSALQLWITIQILFLKAAHEGQLAVTGGPKGLKTDLGMGK